MNPAPQTPKPTPPTKRPVTTEAKIRPAHRRGDVWLVKSDPNNPSVGNELWADRPAVIVSNDVFNRRSGFALVVFLTTSEKKARSGPTNVQLPPMKNAKGTPSPNGSIALCSQIHTVDVSRLDRRFGFYEAEELLSVEAGLTMALAIGKHGAPATSAMFHKWDKQLDEHGIEIAQEIQALSGQTADERVTALIKANQLLLTQRDSYRLLYEAAQDEINTANNLSRIMIGEEA